MKYRSLIVVLLIVLTGNVAFAGENIFREFLNRYRPDQTSVLSTGTAAQDVAFRGTVGNTLPLTVENAIRLLLESNLNVRVGRYSPLMNEYAIRSAFRLFEPTLTMGAGMSRNTSPTISELDGASVPSTLGHNYFIGFSQLLRTGANIDVDFNVNRTSSNNRFFNFNPSFSSSLTYAISQPLLRGRGRNITTRAIRVAKNNKEISDLDFEIQLIEMVSQAQLLYWDLVNAQEGIKVQQRSLELARKTLSDNRRQIEVGTLAPIDIVQAETVVASREEQVIRTSYGNDQLQNQMKRLISRTTGPAIVLTKLDPVEAAPQPRVGDLLPLEDAIRVALETRPEMRRLDLQFKSNQMDVEFAKNDLLPQVNLNARYTHSGIGGVQTFRDEFGNIIDVKRGGFPNAMGQLFGYNFTGYSVGFNVSIPLTNKAAQSDYTRVVLQHRLLDDQRAAQSQAIALEVQNAHSQVEMNRVSIEAAHKSLELARRQLSAEERKNQLGISPIKFVLDAQNEMTAAETREIQAVIQYTQALVRYDQAIGRTLQKNSVGVEKELRFAED